MATRFKELTLDEQAVLADAVRRGRSAAATQEDIAAAADARKDLMECYAPLAAKMSEKYAPKLGRQEALSAAYLGLALALRSWDPDKGALPSWVRLYCKMTLLREVDNRALIKIPQVIAPKRAMLLHYRAQGIEDTEIAERIKVDITDLDELAKHPQVSVWLDAQDHETFGDTDAVPETTTQVQSMLLKLDEPERVVLSARFGVGYDGLCHTYEEIAEMLDVKPEDVMVIEAKGIKNLRDLTAQEQEG